MTQVFQVTDEEFASLLSYGNRIGETPESLLTRWLHEKLNQEAAYKRREEEQAQHSPQANLPSAFPANPSMPVPEEEEIMHEFVLTDEQYAAFVEYADIAEKTPQQAFDNWVDMKLTFLELGIVRIPRERQAQKSCEEELPDLALVSSKGSVASSAPEKEEKS